MRASRTGARFLWTRLEWKGTVGHQSDVDFRLILGLLAETSRRAAGEPLDAVI